MYFPKVYFLKVYFLKVYFPTCIFRKCIFRKYIFRKCVASMQVFWVQTFSTQRLPSPNFFKLSVPGGLRIFRAFASLFVHRFLFISREELFQTYLCPSHLISDEMIDKERVSQPLYILQPCKMERHVLKQENHQTIMPTAHV